MFNLRGWLRQPSTIHGIGAAAADVAVLVPGYEYGQVPVWVVAGVAIYSLIHLLMPDNTAAATDARQLAVDFTRGAMTHAINMQTLMRDSVAVLADLTTVPIPANQPVKTADLVNQGTVYRGTVVSLGTIAAMAALLVVTLGLTACGTPAQQQLACQTDAAVVPIADATLTALIPGAAAGIAIDTALVHPAVVKYCAGLGGTPVAAPGGSGSSIVTPAATPLVPATTPAATPAATTTTATPAAAQ